MPTQRIHLTQPSSMSTIPSDGRVPGILPAKHFTHNLFLFLHQRLSLILTHSCIPVTPISQLWAILVEKFKLASMCMILLVGSISPPMEYIRSIIYCQPPPPLQRQPLCLPNWLLRQTILISAPTATIAPAPALLMVLV